jgi:5-methylcytosine-specific restriction protein A
MNRHRHYDKYKRNKEARTFYKSMAWEKCRKIVLIRDNYLCQECLLKGKITAANTVHHIKSYEDHSELALDPDNLESICPSCHNKEHPEKGQNKDKKAAKKKKKNKYFKN